MMLPISASTNSDRPAAGGSWIVGQRLRLLWNAGLGPDSTFTATKQPTYSWRYDAVGSRLRSTTGLSAAAREGDNFSTHAQDLGSHHVALPRSDCRRQETPVHRG